MTMPGWLQSDYVEVVYRITLEPGMDIVRISREIALEQTVEVPEECVQDATLWERVIGRILDITPAEGRNDLFYVVIGYPPEVTGFQIPQFLNVLFGNISIKRNICIVDLRLPRTFMETLPGPRWGIEGLRARLGVYDRPLASTALKPMGTSPEALAQQAAAFALGGGDLIKDDHGLGDQAFCPFRERVARCQEALARAGQLTGRQTLYFPNVIGNHAQVIAQVEFALEQQVAGILISPFLVGPALVEELARNYPLAIMTHPAFSGTHFHDRRHGITPAVLLGTIFRLLGADISVFPNSGGRFGFSASECQALAHALRQPWSGLKPVFPAPAGGMNLERISQMAQQYGADTVYLIGGALLKYQDLQEGTREFMQAIRMHFQERLLAPVRN